MKQNYPLSLCGLTAAAVGLVLTACTSPPARFYTLDTVQAEPVTGALADRRIVVGPIGLPGYLDRPQMVIRDQQGELVYQEFRRWAEPLDAAFLRVFSLDLSVAAGTEQVISIPISQLMSADYRVLARVSRFDVDRSGRARLDVQWYAADAKGNIIIAPRKASYSRSVPVPLEPAASVAALSGTIADFAVDVARSLAAAKIPAS